MVLQACDEAGTPRDELDFIVPHQANQRILDAIEKRMGIPVFSCIENWGNTSSSSIPIALETMLRSYKPNLRLCLAAFGGGLTRSRRFCSDATILMFLRVSQDRT